MPASGTTEKFAVIGSSRSVFGIEAGAKRRGDSDVLSAADRLDGDVEVCRRRALWHRDRRRHGAPPRSWSVARLTADPPAGAPEPSTTVPTTVPSPAPVCGFSWRSDESGEVFTDGVTETVPRPVVLPYVAVTSTFVALATALTVSVKLA